MGAGGVIRNEHEQWVGGFAANFEKGKAIDAELLALHTGLEYAWKSGWFPLEVETDVMKAVRFVMFEVKVDRDHPQFNMNRSCQAVLNQNWRCCLHHVYREQNCVADSLAIYGLTMEPGCQYSTDPPSHCIPLLDEDQSGVARPRLITPRAMQCRLNYLRNLKNQTASSVVPKSYGFNNKYVRSMEKVKVEEMDALAPVTFTWKIDNKTASSLVPKSYGFKNKYVRSMEKVKLDEMDALAPVTFTWKIDNFSNLDTASKHYSDTFVTNKSKWRILLYLKGNAVDYFAPYLYVADASTFPQGWSRCAQFSFTVVNQLHPSKSITKDAVHVFNACDSGCGFKFLVPLSWLSAHSNEYLVNDICVLEAKVVLHQAKAKYSVDKTTFVSSPVRTSEEVFKE